MILLDANLLIYAVNQDMPEHPAARAWFERTLSGPAPVGLPMISALAFFRLCTHPRVFAHPLSPAGALAYLDEWLAQPVVRWVAPGAAHWKLLRQLLAQHAVVGNLSPDAHLAALALEHGYTLYSADRDFARFTGLRWCNPLEPGTNST